MTSRANLARNKATAPAASDAPARPLASLPEQIAEALGAAIFRGEYEPGQSIPEQRVADHFRVSRGPVREALRILEREAVVVIVPRHGAQVTKLTIAEVVEIYEIRATLFGLAAGLFAERRRAESLKRLAGRLDELGAIAAEPAAEATESHSRVSALMAQIVTGDCGNARLAQMIHQMARQIARYTKLGLSSKERRAQSIASWRRLVAAVKVKDAAGAEATAREMVLNTMRHAVRVLEGVTSR